VAGLVQAGWRFCSRGMAVLLTRVATFSATISDTTPSVIDDLLARVGDDPAIIHPAGPDNPLTGSNPGAASSPSCRKGVPDPAG
jgi:hypothetical protein